MSQVAITNNSSQPARLMQLAIPLAFLCTFITTIGSLVSVGAETEQNSYLQRSFSDPSSSTSAKPQLMVAIYCGNGNGSPSVLYHNQYLDLDTKSWRSDSDPAAYCTHNKKDVLKYCKKVYPKHRISNIVESSQPYKIDRWCKVSKTNGKRRCRARLSVKPYRCLEGSFQSDALLVPERCLFDHVHNKSSCEESYHWNTTATQNCQTKGMKLQSFAMLQPCGLGVFSGVEFVCCPNNLQQQQQSLGDSFTPTNSAPLNKESEEENSVFANNQKSSANLDESSNIKKQQSSDTNEQNAQLAESVPDADDDDEYEEDEDEYDDDSSSSWNGDSSSSTTSTTTTTTTTTTERPVDHYLSHFDLAHERDEFRRAEIAVENDYKDKITHVMHDWTQLNAHYEDLKKKDPQAAEEYKKKMTSRFQKTVGALEEEGNAQRQQLASMHAERAMAIINRRKKTAMDCLTQALDKVPIRSKQVERCIGKLLKALEKDRSYTLRQYRNLLNLNTREALREKKIILDHLVTLNRAANQSIAMLDRSPVLADELKAKIVRLWHKLRDVPDNEPIVKESELKIMEKYEEEVAQHKIELERLKLAREALQYTTETSTKVSEINSEPSISTVSSEKIAQRSSSVYTTSDSSVSEKPDSNEIMDSIKPENILMQNSYDHSNTHSLVQEENHELLDNKIHSQIESARFAHLKVDANQHELSYSVKHEPIENSAKFNHTGLLVLTGSLAVLVALFSAKYYSKNSSRSYKRQGFAEVDSTCHEEKNVANMQFNGYENPAYKFFEAEA